MRRIALRVLVVLTCVVAVGCGSSPTSPDDPPPAGGGPSGGGGGAGPTGETAIASDDVFDDGDWDTEVQVSGSGGTGGASHLHYLGQASGDYRQVTITVNGGAGSQVAVFSIKRGTAYTPSSDGAIFSVDYSEQSILLSGSGGSQYSAPAFKQNGKLYTLVPGAGAFPTPELTWTPHSITGLTQNNFRTLASASDHPNFSATGSRIEVGFMRLHAVPAGNGGGTLTGGIDNWRITLRR